MANCFHLTLFIILLSFTAQMSSYLINPKQQIHENFIRLKQEEWNNNTDIVTEFNTCLTDSDCIMDSVCHEAKCVCYLGYSWSNLTFRCRPHHCFRDEHCFNLAHTKCQFGLCLCEDNYNLDWNSQTCKFSYISKLQMMERSIPIMVLFVACILLVCAIARCYCLRRKRTSPQVTRTESQTAIDDERISTLLTETYYTYCDQLIANDTHTYPPPPPYASQNTQTIEDDAQSIYSTAPPPYSEEDNDQIATTSA